jgi:SAM-dependent methyltransferase
MAPEIPLAVDFGRTASDYARHRPGFPDAFFDHVRTLGIGLPGQRVLDVVCAGTCWHWFDRPRAAAEAMRVLKKGGLVLVAYFAYLPTRGSVAAATEEVLQRHNPKWPWAGHDGRHPWCLHDLVGAGMRHVTTFDFVLPIVFTHEEWRGRFRAHAGVVTLPDEGMAAFDAELAALLADRFQEPVVSEHRVYGIVAEKP